MILQLHITDILASFSVWDGLVVAGLLLLLAIQVLALWQNKANTQSRFGLKIGLNILLWLSIAMLFLNPTWQQSADTNRVLLVSNGIGAEVIKKVKDSLKIGETFSQKAFNKKVLENPTFTTQLGSVYLLGQDAQPEIISKLSHLPVHWIPYFRQGELQDIRWNAVVRKGEIQEVSGKINLSAPQIIRLKYANQVVDSLSLPKGFSNFTLRFPAFSIGQTSLDLFLDDTFLQPISYYSLKNQAYNILFVLSNPDFESKTLADWLGRNGNQVQTITTVAKNTQNTVSINKVGKFEPDIVITDASNAGNALVKKALNDGKSILFINFDEPETGIKNINQNLATKWRLKRTSNQENRVIAGDLTAHPYDFEPSIWQKKVVDYPVAIQKKAGKVGVSLLNETFPMILSGDSLTYFNIWQSTLQALLPASSRNIIIEAPIFRDVPQRLQINTAQNGTKTLKLAKDTIPSIGSAINPMSSRGDYIFRIGGWQTFQDILSVYVEEQEGSIGLSKRLQPYLEGNFLKKNTVFEKNNNTLWYTPPEWAWYIIIVLILTALWIEPKL